MKNLKTVNIIEVRDGQIQSLIAFPDDKKGNLAAEKLFMDLMLKNDLKDRQNFLGVDYYLDEGVYSNNEGYYLYIVHSN